MRGNCCVGCWEEVCLRQGALEQRTTCDQKAWFSTRNSFLLLFVCFFVFLFCFFFQIWNVEYEVECTQVGKLTGMVAGYYQRNGEQKWLSLKNIKKKIMSLNGSQRIFSRSCLTFSCLFFLRKKQQKNPTFAVWVWCFWRRRIWSEKNINE